jgi:S1-C subfamily serine protease
VRLAGSGSGVKRGKVTKVRSDSILTTLEAAPGDSGAPVVNDRNELVGILWSSGKEGAIVLSIDPILRELRVTLAPPH